MMAVHHFSPPYNPRANGLAERWFQSVVNAIRELLDRAASDWDLIVCGVQLGSNTRVASLHNSVTPLRSLSFSLALLLASIPATLPSIASVSTISNGNWDESILH